MKLYKLHYGIIFTTLYMLSHLYGATYHIDSIKGDDENNGLSPNSAISTLKKASQLNYKAGDRLLLKRGLVYKGTLYLKGIKLNENNVLTIDAYGDHKNLPVINSAGYIGGITLEESSQIKIKNIEIVSDGGKEIDELAKKERFGIYVFKSNHISIQALKIHTIFSTIQTPSEGKNKSTAYGHGIRIDDSKDVLVEKCMIEKVGRYGINSKRSENLKILNNKTDHTGCSGLQMSKTKNVLVKGNLFDHPGSFIDKRMHGRGSGSWVWSCEDVLYENNTFLNAVGKADSCGVHIDFNCNNIVIQRCFSMNNEGGFIEILGNNFNCSYRYNISVNDGARKKGQDGAHQEGKVLWLSGYSGRKKGRIGPFNSYIYNNTIYVKEGMNPKFSISPSTKGALIANNIFHLLGKSKAVIGDQKKYSKSKSKVENVIFENNIYNHSAVLPTSLKINDKTSMIGDVKFKKAGGEFPENYIPTNIKLVKDKSKKVLKLPGDEIGLTIGFEVKKDYFGNAIKGIPDIGAVELP